MSNTTVTLNDVLKFISTATKEERNLLVQAFNEARRDTIMAAKAEFRVGDKVTFKNKYGDPLVGTVIKKNSTTCTVLVGQHTQYRVTPTIMTKVE